MIWPGFYYDSTMLLMLPALIFALYAQWRVSAAITHNNGIQNTRGISGLDVARTLLTRNGLAEVPVILTEKGDHYDPLKRTVCLSRDVYQGSSLTSLGVAAHEVGHALQHQQSYLPLALRSGFFPIANFASTAAWPILLLGLMLSIPFLMDLGVIIFAAAVFFQILSLPVEYNASRRAMQLLHSNGMIVSSEEHAVKGVLDAAALTYVAAAATAVLTLLRYMMLSSNSKRRR